MALNSLHWLRQVKLPLSAYQEVKTVQQQTGRAPKKAEEGEEYERESFDISIMSNKERSQSYSIAVYLPGKIMIWNMNHAFFKPNGSTALWSRARETVKGIAKSLAIAPFFVDGHRGKSRVFEG
jgi:hypothetical protein